MPQTERARAIQLINEACAQGAGKKKACELLGISIRTLERWVHNEGGADGRKNAMRLVGNKLTAEEKKRMLSIVHSEVYRDLPPSKIVPLLADKGDYIASESSFYRLLRATNQLTHRGKSKVRQHKKPKICRATGPNQVWSWDITYLPDQILGKYFYLYMIIDVFSRKIVGWSIHHTESAEQAAALIKQACLDERVEEAQLTLHSDNGSPMKGATMLAMLQVLGVIPSFSRPCVSDDNPYSESLFKTLKYHPTFPALSKFETIVDARQWCIQFVKWYNYQHKHSGLKFITPHQRHCGDDKQIMENRHNVYQLAQQKNPERWSKKTRNWALPTEVTLNPDRKRILSKKTEAHDMTMVA